MTFTAPETQTLSDRLDAAADALTGAAATLRAADPAGSAFATGHDGAPGVLGQALAARWAATLDARAAELEAAATRAATTADAVRTAHQRYATTDAEARHRLAAGADTRPGRSA